MKRVLLFPLLVLSTVSCIKQSIKPGRSDLEIIYVVEVPQDAKAWAGFGAELSDFKQDPLVVVDDPELSSAGDLAWWMGERERFLLETVGCDLLFPPSSWYLLGPEWLRDISDEASFFITALDVVDETGNYPLSRYMVRQHSPYRIAFSSAANRKSDYRLESLRFLPLDSILPVTASFLSLQTDFFIFFSEDKDVPDMPGNIYFVSTQGSNRRMGFRFLSRVEFKLKETSFTWSSSGDKDTSPLTLWKSHADSLDGEIVGRSNGSLSTDSLRALASKTLEGLALEQVRQDSVDVSVDVILPLGFMTEGIPFGDITFGDMRRIMSPEIFVLVPGEVIAGINTDEFSGFEVDKKPDWVLVPVSLLEDVKIKDFKPTGISSATLAREMFAEEETE